MQPTRFERQACSGHDGGPRGGERFFHAGPSRAGHHWRLGTDLLVAEAAAERARARARLWFLQQLRRLVCGLASV